MLSIGTMAALCGTSVQTLRLYDKKGLLPAARIDPDSGYRYYTNGQIFLFQTIRLLQRTGIEPCGNPGNPSERSRRSPEPLGQPGKSHPPETAGAP